MDHLYTTFMTEYLALGHMEKVIENEEPRTVCYIPHHGVYKESSSTTKLRTVFNASRKTLENISLNDCLHVGPKLQSDLSQIIIRWRLHRIGFMADIEKCYRQILVSRDDADMQRIIWRGTEGEPAAYRLLTVTYGLNCSRYLAIKVQTLADDEESTYPEASKVLRESFYVDDCLHGADSVDAALEIQYQLRQLLQRGGFVLRKWSSNAEDFMQRLSADDKENTICCNLNLDRTTKALGIYWLCDSDSLTYKVSLSPLTTQITKWQQLSDIGKIYDPPELLAPITLTGKAMCRKLWVAGLNWDDPIPEPLQQEWQRFRKELGEVERLRIPRWLGVEPNSRGYQLHVFSDASAIAYAAVAYL
ncbi:uncharacterized protein LOC118756555, partial [Rhagoletis pomonella]|uniref:uncharacterized protein LOC118756555 n=1 Tax=Rhagoletis pomonella TaxID=28610 RepID=UPI00177F6375